DRPFAPGDEALHALEAAHADAGIELDLGAHAGGAVLDAFLQGPLGARAYVLDRHALLQRGDAFHRAQPAALLRRAAVDDAGLVEMGVGLDQPRTGQASLRAVDFRLGDEAVLDRDDAALVHADVEQPARRPVGKTCVVDDEIHERSLGLDVGSLDQGPPLLDLGPLVRGER